MSDELAAYRYAIAHSHAWQTVDRDEHGEIQLCGCGAARRRPDGEGGQPGEEDNPGEPVKTIPWPRAGKGDFLDPPGGNRPHPFVVAEGRVTAPARSRPASL